MLGGTGESASPSAASFLWVAARVEARVAFQVAGAFHLAAGIGLAAPFTRGQFTIADTPGLQAPTTVFRPAAASARAWLGPELLF